MTFFDFLTMVGGLALFLYGMELLGEGLTEASGGRLEKILEKLTSSPLKAVLVGAGVTGVIQSSSATTVMVVGFVNSGIMNLKQAVGIIMGANIGTTVTSWILSLAGIDSENFWIRMLNPNSFSPILAIVGVVILLFAKSEKPKHAAKILLGFAVLMFGMDTMSGAVEPLAEVPEFTGMLTKFTFPLYGVLAGLVLTAIIQSSSASVGILQALCLTGAVPYGAAIPIIMGQNIGTCVTAIISSIGASRNAKRAALMHLYFNIIGTILFLVCFYTINAFAPFAFLADAATPVGIAVIHSCFNVATTVILLPFSNVLVKLACLTLPEREAAKEETETDRALGLLDVRFLEKPSYAVEQAREAATVMAHMAERSMDLAMELLQEYDEAKAGEVLRMENDIDRFEDELGTYLVKLSAKPLPAHDSETLNKILHCIGDFERISDHAKNIKEAAEEMQEKELRFSEKAREELCIFESAVRDILKLTMDSFVKDDLTLARRVEPLEEVIDGLSLDIKQRHVKRLRKGKCTIELGFILSDIVTNFERVSDHCSNVAVCLVQVDEDEFDTHAYLDELRRDDNIDYQGMVMAYRERYLLP